MNLVGWYFGLKILEPETPASSVETEIMKYGQIMFLHVHIDLHCIDMSPVITLSIRTHKPLSTV